MGRNTERFRRWLSSPSPMVMDGAMGTELNARGVETTLPLWSAIALMDAPDAVRRIHIDHIEAGARVVTTNTFRTSLRTLGRAGLAHRAAELTRLAVELADGARRTASEMGFADEDEVFIAGSIAPLEDCWSPELSPDRGTARKEHGLMARALANSGVDLLLVETQSALPEALGAAGAARAAGLPLLVSFTLSPGGALLDGTDLGDAVKEMERAGADMLMLNCFPAQAMDGAVARLRELTDLPFGAYANMGIPDDVEGWDAKGALTPEEYAVHARRWVDSGAVMIGGCCGTGPEHIRALSEIVRC